MKKYKIFNAFYMWIFSKDFYVDLIKNRKGVGFIYLFILLMLLWVPRTVKMQTAVSKFYKEEGEKAISQVPEIKIIDGIVSAGVKQPYIINDSGTDNALYIIDTTGKYNNFDDCPDTVKLLLTKNRFFMAGNNYDKREYDLSGVKNFVINKVIVKKWADIFFNFLFAAVYPFGVVFSFIFRMFTVLIYALIGLIISRILKTDLKFDAIMRVTSIALTPGLIYIMIKDLMMLPVIWPLSLLIFSVLTAAYIIFAVISYKKDISEISGENKQTMIVS